MADGSVVTLDTATLVRVTFTAGSRRLVLERGRARFRVASDSRRPFVVAVPGGEVVARDAIFDVSVTERPARIAAIGGPVDLRSTGPAPTARPQTLAAGQQALLDSSAAPKPISRTEARWVSGSREAAAAARVERAGMVVLSDGVPAICDPTLRATIRAAADATGHSATDIASGAGHDAAFMATVCPSAMIFIPCLRGMSHTPDEYSTPEQLAAGTAVLLETVRRLDAGL